MFFLHNQTSRLLHFLWLPVTLQTVNLVPLHIRIAMPQSVCVSCLFSSCEQAGGLAHICCSHMPVHLQGSHSATCNNSSRKPVSPISFAKQSRGRRDGIQGQIMSPDRRRHAFQPKPGQKLPQWWWLDISEHRVLKSKWWGAALGIRKQGLRQRKPEINMCGRMVLFNCHEPLSNTHTLTKHTQCCEGFFWNIFHYKWQNICP